jgi:hypothetical protein
LSADPVTGAVSVTDVRQAGVYTVTVKAMNGIQSASTTFTLTVTYPFCSQGLFQNPAGFGVGSMPVSIAAGEFNGDGHTDLVTANFQANASVRLGDGSGGFSGSTEVSAGSNPRSVAVGDFNGDGKQDLAIGNANGNNVSIRMGNGSGGFAGLTDIPVGPVPYGVIVNCVTLGDFNGDGRQDFATANWGTNSVSIRIGDGTGGFSGITEVSVGSGPACIVIGDFNADGFQDFATSNQNSDDVSVRMGDGSGAFSGN